MVQITGGKVSFSRTVQPEPYGSKRTEVELTFAVGEGEDLGNKLDQVGELVIQKVAELMQLKPAVGSKATVTAAPAQPAGGKEAAAAALNAKDKPAATKPAEKGKPGPKPAAKVEDKPAASDELSETFDETFNEADAPLPEVTDTAMSVAMNKKVSALKEKHGGAAPALIRALIQKYVEPPKKSTDIPQTLRHDFLAKLEALT